MQFIYKCHRPLTVSKREQVQQRVVCKDCLIRLVLQKLKLAQTDRPTNRWTESRVYNTGRYFRDRGLRFRHNGTTEIGFRNRNFIVYLRGSKIRAK